MLKVCVTVWASLLSLFATQGLGQAIDFSRDIRPILSDNCLQCHGLDPERRRAGLRLDIAEGFGATLKSGAVAVVPNDLGQSELWRRITHEDADEKMPPLDSGKSLTAQEIELIQNWIEQGALYTDHWAFVPPQRPDLPAVGEAAWPINPIDHFVLARLDEAGLEPSPEADAHILLRRLSFDLRGLPPTPEEVTEILGDRRPGAYRRLVDRWLASPRYGERMAQDWLDAARYADTTGHAADVPRTMWLFRDWVIDALNRNQPFDQFTIEQLAGDLIPGATQAQKIATGFHRNSMQALGNNPRKEEFRVKGIVDRLDTTGRVWLGLTLACAECHDHKYDPISTEEYYSLYAIFNNVPHLGEKFEIHGPRMEVLLEEEQRQWDRYQREIDRTQNTLAAMEESQIARRRSEWETNPSVRFDLPEQLVYQVPIEEGVTLEDSPWGDGVSRALSAATGAIAVQEPLSLDGELTVSLWIKTESPVSDLVSKFDWKAGQRSFAFGIGGQRNSSDYRPGHLYAWISSKSEPFEGIELMGSLPINDGLWHHVALTFRPGIEASLWVDGQRDAKAKSKGAVPTRIADSDRALIIGGGYQNSKAPNAFFYEGLIHDVRLYSRALRDMALLGGSNLAERDAMRTPAEQRDAEQQEVLAAYFRRIDPVRQRLLQQIDNAKQAQAEVKTRAITAQVMDELSEPRKTHVHVRGNFENPGEQVSPGTPSFLPQFPASQPVNRHTFAQWLVDGRNPLPARVTVNRFWAHYFGQGLVTTVDDFGIRGAAPSHQELLDWLAVELMASGWDMKALNRLIVTSATYRQSSRIRLELAERDPTNRLLARGPRIRLPAEQVRDNTLAVSGLLTPRIGGPSVYPPQPEGVGEFRDLTAGQWETSEGEDRYRRSLYTFWQRMSPYPSLTIFDAPSRERSCVRRSPTNTPLQALALLNDPSHVDMAQALAGRIIDRFTDTDSRLEYAFLLVLARAPEPDERARFLAFAREQRTNDPIDDRHLWTLIAQVLLNMDETITKE